MMNDGRVYDRELHAIAAAMLTRGHSARGNRMRGCYTSCCTIETAAAGACGYVFTHKYARSSMMITMHGVTLYVIELSI